MAVFSSSPYLDRLNNPTEWTKRIMPALLHMNRSLCRVVMSAGIGAGRFMQTIRFSPEQGREAELRDALQHELRSLVNAGCLCAAHLLVADRGSSAVATREKELRGGRDAVADWVLLVEGYDQQAVAENRTARLTRSGAHPAIADHLYTLDHLVSLRPPGSA